MKAGDSRREQHQHRYVEHIGSRLRPEQQRIHNFHIHVHLLPFSIYDLQEDREGESIVREKRELGGLSIDCLVYF